MITLFYPGWNFFVKTPTQSLTQAQLNLTWVWHENEPAYPSISPPTRIQYQMDIWSEFLFGSGFFSRIFVCIHPFLKKLVRKRSGFTPKSPDVFFYPKFFGPKFFWSLNCFGPTIVFEAKFFLELNFFWDPKNFGSKFFSDSKCFSDPKLFSDPKFFFTQFFYAKVTKIQPCIRSHL